MESRSVVILFIFLGLFVSSMSIAHRWENYSLNFEKNTSDNRISLRVGHILEIRTIKEQAKKEYKKPCTRQKTAEAHPKKLSRIYHWVASLLERDSSAQSIFSFTIRLDV